MEKGFDKGEEKQKTFGWFVPQLFTYFLRLLSLYDGAMQGESVEAFFAKHRSGRVCLPSFSFSF